MAKVDRATSAERPLRGGFFALGGASGRAASRKGRFDELDLENLIEEVEDLSASASAMR